MKIHGLLTIAVAVIGCLAADNCVGQTYTSAPLPFASSKLNCRDCDTSVVNAVYPAFFAPQVPVGVLPNGTMATMSAYYVPTAPIIQPVIVERTHRRWKHHHFRHSVPVVPIAIHPVYWYPY